jgi:hypothetical protein
MAVQTKTICTNNVHKSSYINSAVQVYQHQHLLSKVLISGDFGEGDTLSGIRDLAPSTLPL